MEKQVLVISYVGEKPTPEEAAAAIVAMQRAGTYIDTTVQPTMCHLSEKEVAQAILMFSERKQKRGEGITIQVENPDSINGIDRTKMSQLIAVLKDTFNV